MSKLLDKSENRDGFTGSFTGDDDFDLTLDRNNATLRFRTRNMSGGDAISVQEKVNGTFEEIANISEDDSVELKLTSKEVRFTVSGYVQEIHWNLVPEDSAVQFVA